MLIIEWSVSQKFRIHLLLSGYSKFRINRLRFYLLYYKMFHQENVIILLVSVVLAHSGAGVCALVYVWHLISGSGIIKRKCTHLACVCSYLLKLFIFVIDKTSVVLSYQYVVARLFV